MKKKEKNWTQKYFCKRGKFDLGIHLTTVKSYNIHTKRQGHG
jgi:hypothetical protein